MEVGVEEDGGEEEDRVFEFEEDGGSREHKNLYGLSGLGF